MFSTGDVVLFFNRIANKPKFHLCVNSAGYFFFMNSPKEIRYEGDFIVPMEHLPFLPRQEYSIVSCSLLMEYHSLELSRLHALKKGAMQKEIFRDLVSFIEKIEVLEQKDKDKVFEGFRNWR